MASKTKQGSNVDGAGTPVTGLKRENRHCGQTGRARDMADSRDVALAARQIAEDHLEGLARKGARRLPTEALQAKARRSPGSCGARTRMGTRTPSSRGSTASSPIPSTASLFPRRTRPWKAAG